MLMMHLLSLCSYFRSWTVFACVDIHGCRGVSASIRQLLAAIVMASFWLLWSENTPWHDQINTSKWMVPCGASCGFQPRTLLLWGDSANHCTTVSPSIKTSVLLISWCLLWLKEQILYKQQVRIQQNSLRLDSLLGMSQTDLRKS